MIWSALALRSLKGLSEINICPVFTEPPPPPAPPIKPPTASTLGLSKTLRLIARKSCCMAPYEMLCEAMMLPFRRPVSSCGKKPLGTRTYSTPARTITSTVTSPISRVWLITQPRVRS